MDIQPEDFEAEEQKNSLLQGKDLLGGMDDINADGSYYMGGVNNGKGLGALFKAFLFNVCDFDQYMDRCLFNRKVGSLGRK